MAGRGARWLAGETGVGTAFDVAVMGDHAYLADYTAGLQVLDVSEASRPVRVGRASIAAGEAWAVALDQNHAFVACEENGLRIANVEDATQPQLVGAYAGAKNVRGVAVSGAYAYLADRTLGLEVVGVGNPAEPQRAGSIDGFEAQAVVVRDNRAYVAGGPDGLVIVAFAVPPRFEAPLRLDPDGFRIGLRGAAGQAIRLQRSEDLVHWEDWAEVTGTGERQEHTDVASPEHARQFYRAIVR